MNHAIDRDNVLSFPDSNEKASLEKGYYRIANQIGMALCRVRLSDRESRVVHAVLMKTYGFNKDMDWICNEQLCEMTGISSKNISRVKKSLVDRAILVVNGQKIGLNPMLSEWVLSKQKRPKMDSRQAKNSPPETNPKRSKNRSNSVEQQTKIDLKTDRNPPPEKAFNPVNSDGAPRQFQRHAPSESDVSAVSSNGHKRQDTITKDKVTKDSARERPKKNTTQAPSDFTVTTELFNWANQNQIQTDLILETEKFLDYHRAKGSKFKDWTAAWRNWMRNSKRFARPQFNATQSANNAPMFSQDVQEWIDADDASPLSEARMSALTQGVFGHEPF
ncbi:replication protein [Vibrio penaeicida]|uniref:replication protein n=1 Tax=Vibrio penaeicida TaxID=104609 RepID=UPI000CEA1C78|nr:replication protein [Vibrio penaeicida]